MQPILTKEAILAYLSEIKPSLEKDGIQKIGLFGSYAKGYADEE
ncbi:nucleotidyltransferase domain-containing protein, partial [Campylobacter hyointestinalis]